MKRWAASDYVFSDSEHRYVVNGDLKCEAARENESFGDTNTKFVYKRASRGVELRLVARVPEGFYEALVNYTSPHMKSPYWTEDKIICFPMPTQRKARQWYNMPRG